MTWCPIGSQVILKNYSKENECQNGDSQWITNCHCQWQCPLSIANANFHQGRPGWKVGPLFWCLFFINRFGCVCAKYPGFLAIVGWYCYFKNGLPTCTFPWGAEIVVVGCYCCSNNGSRHNNWKVLQHCSSNTISPWKTRWHSHPHFPMEEWISSTNRKAQESAPNCKFRGQALNCKFLGSSPALQIPR